MKRLLILLMGCGTTSTPSTDWVPEDIDQNATIDRIGSAGYAKLCSAFDDFVHDQFRSNRLVQAACTAQALRTTSDAVACGAAIDTCLDTLPPVVEAQLDAILDQASCNAVAIMPTGCAAKVVQLKTCLDELGSAVDRVMFSLTCAAIGSPVPDDWWRVQLPAACMSLSTAC